MSQKFAAKKFSVNAILVVLFAVSSALSSSTVSARTLSDLDAVQKSAWQRTLTLRIAKAHVQMAANIDYLGASARLAATIDEYSQSMNELEMNTPNSLLNQRMARLQAIWQRFRETAESIPGEASVATIVDLSNDLMYENDRLMRQWQERLPKGLSDNMDLAFQQSMLSERIGLFYVAHYYGMNDAWILDELQQTVSAYEQGMEHILAQSEVEPKLLNQLISNWDYAKFGLEQFNQGKLVPVVMTVTMESMYHQTNKLGDVYHSESRVALNNVRGLANSGLASIYSE